MTALKFNVDADMCYGHLVLDWSHPLCGFGKITICPNSGLTDDEEIGLNLTAKIISDWIKPYSKNKQTNHNSSCRVETEYLSDRMVIAYVFRDENGDYTRNKICIVSSDTDGTTIYNGLFKYKVDNIYAGKRLVREYLKSSGCEVLDR